MDDQNPPEISDPDFSPGTIKALGRAFIGKCIEILRDEDLRSEDLREIRSFLKDQGYVADKDAAATNAAMGLSDAIGRRSAARTHRFPPPSPRLAE